MGKSIRSTLFRACSLDFFYEKEKYVKHTLLKGKCQTWRGIKSLIGPLAINIPTGGQSAAGHIENILFTETFFRTDMDKSGTFHLHSHVHM